MREADNILRAEKVAEPIKPKLRVVIEGRTYKAVGGLGSIGECTDADLGSVIRVPLKTGEALVIPKAALEHTHFIYASRKATERIKKGD